MLLVTKITLYRSPFTICYISEHNVVLPNEQCCKTLCLKTGNCSGDLEIDRDIRDNIESKVYTKKKSLKLVTSALFLRPFVMECLNSIVYRANVLMHLKNLSGISDSETIFFKLILEPLDKEVIDYAWNERIQRLVWSRVEIENAFSWLSTLGGAYSALGDYFENCAEEAGRISLRQYKLSKMLGDESLAARSKLYSALSYAQKGSLRLSRHIVRNVTAFARVTKDERLVRMCQGVWVKLKYLRMIRKKSKSDNSNKTSNGELI